MMAGIKQRIGFRRLKTSFLLTKTVRPPEVHRLHRADYYYSLVESLGIRLEDKIPHLTLSEQARGEAAHFLKQYRERYTYLIAINPSANWALKRWPPQNFVQLIKDLVLLNCAVFLIGTKKPEPLLQESFISSEGSVVNLCGKTSLSQLAALLSQMDLLISSDSGPAHLAAALDRNVLVLFGPTSPALTQPRGEKVTILKERVNCDIPCYNLNCQDNICMRNITPGAVLDKVKNILTDA
jgi:lipopolysaccharide heptosyltransferase II